MLIREVLGDVTTSRGRVFVHGSGPLPADVDLGVSFRPLRDPASTRPGDTVLTFVDDPWAVATYWPSDLPDGVHVVSVVQGGPTSTPLATVVHAAVLRGLQILDAVAISDHGAAVAVVAVRTSRPVPPRPWLSSGATAEIAGDAMIRAALSSHALDRALGTARADTERHQRAILEAERAHLLERIARLESEVPAQRDPRALDDAKLQEIVVTHHHLSRHVAAIYRSRTWRVGRVFWTLAHPVRAWRGPDPNRVITASGR